MAINTLSENDKKEINEKIEIIKGDITKIATDALVNAANNTLRGGGGVDGAIHKAGGKAILEECLKIVEKQGGCPTGEAVITTAGNLPAKKVIHTVGPVWSGGKKGEEEALRNCYRNSLQLAVEHGLETIAFPNISTGVYRFPKDLAARIALEEVTHFLSQNKHLKKVIFVCFDQENYTAMTRLVPAAVLYRAEPFYIRRL